MFGDNGCGGRGSFNGATSFQKWIVKYQAAAKIFKQVSMEPLLFRNG